MTKRQIDIRISKKEKEWEQENKKFNKFLDRSWFIIKRETNRMIDFIMYYKKPKDKFERLLHVGEIVFIYVVLQFAWKGIFS